MKSPPALIMTIHFNEHPLS